jgi:hypothetical protein
MNIPFLKKPSVKFYSDFPEISDQYPIIPAREYKRSWVRNCAKSFARYKEKMNNSRSLITATKCPGMRNVMEKGFIVQSWFDFTIETTDKDFKVFYPDNLETHLKNIGYQNPLVNSFDTKYSPLQIPTGNSLPHIIKIWTPYHFEVPKGYELLVLPIQYDDNLSFSACTGSISGFEIDFNVHVFWHEKNTRIHIPAGTPLCQLVPIKSSSIDLNTLPSTDKVKSEVKKRKFKKYSKFQL